MKTKLIEVESPTYKRRLVREINLALRSGKSVSAVDSIGGYPLKVVSVKFDGGGAIQVRAHNARCTYAKDGQFFDGSGNEIVASRVS